MQLSKFDFYSDYVAYPLTVAALAASALYGAGWRHSVSWGAAFLAGIGIWTLMEYFLHRIALHQIAPLVPLHAAHHSAPRARVGTPVWMSLPLLAVGIFLPAWRIAGFTTASGLTSGVMLGYLWYGFVHHLLHHTQSGGAPRYFEPLRTWHMRHHYSPKKGNYGVTTSLWDRVFRTAI